MTRPQTCFDQLRTRGYKYHAFVSWPHAIPEQGRKFVEDLHWAIEDKLRSWAGGDVFLDTKRLEAGYKWDPEIRARLCRSGAVVVVLLPTFFDSEYCCVEWAVAETLQENRLPADEPNATVFIILELEGNQDLPQEIASSNRYRADRLKHLLAYNDRPRKHKKWGALVDDIFADLRRILELLCRVPHEPQDWEHDKERAATVVAKQFTWPKPAQAAASAPRRSRLIPLLSVDGNKL